jgi:hypothetical protein
VGLKLNGTHQLLVYVDDVNLLSDDIDTMKKKPETLSNASKEFGLKVNAERTMYMLISRHRNKGQNHNMNTVCRSFQNVERLKYFGRIVTNQKLIREEIKNTCI